MDSLAWTNLFGVTLMALTAFMTLATAVIVARGQFAQPIPIRVEEEESNR